jgi:hypothetical protein
MFSLSSLDAMQENEEFIDKLHEAQFAKQPLNTNMGNTANSNLDEVFFENGIKHSAESIISVIGNGTHLLPWQFYRNATSLNTIVEMLNAQDCNAEQAAKLTEFYSRHKTSTTVERPDGPLDIEYSNAIEHVRLDVIDEAIQSTEKLRAILQANENQVALEP